MPNIFDSISSDSGLAVADVPKRLRNIFDTIPATSNVFDGIPSAPGKVSVQPGDFIRNILNLPTINPTAGVHQPSQSSSGFFGPPSAQNVDDWSFTAETAPKIFNNAVTRGVGSGLNFAGQAIKGDAEAVMESLFGGKVGSELANQQLIATAAEMNPAWKAEMEKRGIDTSDPYEDARKTLPVAERIASGIGPGLLQSAPQLALTAALPEIGAASFGFTPEGFDPVQAGAAMIAPAFGKMIGGIAGKLAAKSGINNEQALNVINRLGGGTGVAGLISAPAIYQIAPPGNLISLKSDYLTAALKDIKEIVPANRNMPNSSKPISTTTKDEAAIPEISQPTHESAATTAPLASRFRYFQFGATKTAPRSETAMASEASPSQPGNLSFSEQAELLAQKLESFKTGVANSGQLHVFGIAPDLWDRAIIVAQHLIRSGGTIADAVDGTIRYIKHNYGDTFDERGIRAALLRSLKSPDSAISNGAPNFVFVPGQGRTAKTVPSRESGRYDLRKVPVGSDPISLWQSFPKSEIAVTPQELPKTSDGLRHWTKYQLAKLPHTVRLRAWLASLK